MSCGATSRPHRWPSGRTSFGDGSTRPFRLRAGEGFPARLEVQSIAARSSSETLMVMDDLYLIAGLSTGFGNGEHLGLKTPRSIPTRRRPWLGIADAVEACDKLSETVAASLARYEPEQLRVYEIDTRPHSRLLEFLSYLVTLEPRRVPLPHAPLHEALATGRLSFGIETIEYRGVKHRRLGAMLGIKEYPTPTAVGMFNRLLSAPFPFVLTHQSFAFLSKASGAGPAAAAVQSDDQRGGFRPEPGRGAQGRTRCINQQ